MYLYNNQINKQLEFNKAVQEWQPKSISLFVLLSYNQSEDYAAN